MRIWRVLGAAGLLLMMAVGLQAQDASSAGPTRFEVVSVRMVTPDAGPQAGMTSSISPPGSVTFEARNASVKILIQLAYSMNGSQIVDMPDWMDKVGYDITAKAEGNRGLDYKQLQEPLQALLAERFHLKVHRETREMEGYALVLAKGGPRFGQSEAGEATPIMSSHELKMTNMPMSFFTMLLGKAVERPVVDRTGLTERYDLDVKFAWMGETGSDLPDVFTAVQQLGLKLERGRVPAEVLVIDHVEEMPTAN